MTCTLAISSATGPADVLGTRYSAIELRESIEQQLESCQTVQIDFNGVFVTQSFVDELFDPMILLGLQRRDEVDLEFGIRQPPAGFCFSTADASREYRVIEDCAPYLRQTKVARARHNLGENA